MIFVKIFVNVNCGAVRGGLKHSKPKFFDMSGLKCRCQSILKYIYISVRIYYQKI